MFSETHLFMPETRWCNGIAIFLNFAVISNRWYAAIALCVYNVCLLFMFDFECISADSKCVAMWNIRSILVQFCLGWNADVSCLQNLNCVCVFMCLWTDSGTSVNSHHCMIWVTSHVTAIPSTGELYYSTPLEYRQFGPRTLQTSDTSDMGHCGPRTFRHQCRIVHKTLQHWCQSVLRHWCRSVRKLRH